MFTTSIFATNIWDKAMPVTGPGKDDLLDTIKWANEKKIKEAAEQKAKVDAILKNSYTTMPVKDPELEIATQFAGKNGHDEPLRPIAYDQEEADNGSGMDYLSMVAVVAIAFFVFKGAAK